MFLPVGRRILEADGSDVTINSTTGIPSVYRGFSDNDFFGNSSYNASGEGLVDFGETDLGYSEMQTVFLACIATLIPLVLILAAAIGVRMLWRRFRARKVEGYEGVLQREESSDPLAVKSLSASGNLLTEEFKTSESQFSVTPAEEIEDVTSQSPLLSYGASSGSLPNHTSKSANGSIITMTLKNNHLIVETEERGVTLQDGSTRTTTTKFTTSTSPHENNVFVVEIQQGGAARSSDAELYPKLPSSVVSSQEDIDEEDGSRRSSSQRAQVHRPPDMDVDEASDEDDLEVEDDEDEDEDDDTTDRNITRDGTGEDGRDGSTNTNTNTGLSQSDLSISSSGSNNPSYRYGNQVGYEGGHFGYPQYVGYTASDEKIERTAGGENLAFPRRNIPMMTAMARAFSVMENSEKTSSNQQVRGRYSIAVTSDGNRLLSDIQAIERRRQQEEERLQEEQRQLGNGTMPLAVANGSTTPSPVNDKMEDDNQNGVPALQRAGSLPSQLEETYANADQNDCNKDGVNSKPETQADKMAIEVNYEKVDGNGVSVAKKRGSVPVIKPQLYTQIKQTTKSLILDKTSRPGLSPKFEKFRNENSPLDETEKDAANQAAQVPAKSQEYENEAFVPSDQIAS